ncbi:MAG: pilus assembly protein TadG-related protein, partial [Chloroflexota bacterium]
MRLPCNTAKREGGQILVMGVVLLTLLMGMLGLVVDGGSFFQQRRQAQSAADSAALAAAGALKDGASASTAIAAAKEYAANNGFNNDGSSNTVTVNIPPTSGDHVGSSSYAEVFISEKPRTFFIQVVLNAGTVGGRGVAGFAAGAPCAMCVLSPHAHQALSLSNNGNLTVVNGGVVVNSDQSDAAMLTNNASITATS